jgi:anaphase-promoting complex subunit 3
MVCTDHHTDRERRVMPDTAAIQCLIGKLRQAQGDSGRAVTAFITAVKLNPFLWEAFTGLCETGKSRKSRINK